MPFSTIFFLIRFISRFLIYSNFKTRFCWSLLQCEYLYSFCLVVHAKENVNNSRTCDSVKNTQMKIRLYMLKISNFVETVVKKYGTHLSNIALKNRFYFDSFSVLYRV